VIRELYEYYLAVTLVEKIDLAYRQNIPSGGKYEKIVGYSRAVKIGNLIFVSGTTGILEENNQDNGPYAQARRAIEKIKTALISAGGSLDDVVRTRIFIAPGVDWQEVAKAHAEFFGNILPANSMLVCNLLDARMVVEIEADAVLRTQ
jgi:enamine deaminase RidA (YjgF/YER057c/UK114 family)